MDFLKQIREKADREHIFLRGIYKKRIYDVKTEWYILEPQIVLEISDGVGNEKYEKMGVATIKGYKVPKGCHLFEFFSELPAVSREFVEVCKENKMNGVSFAWIPDDGRYQAPAYYSLIPEKMVSRIAGETDACSKSSYKYYGINRMTRRERYKRIAYDKERLLNLYRQADWDGGHLSFLESIIDNLYACIPIMIDQKGVPDMDFAYLTHGEHMEVIIRKSAAEKLVEAGVLRQKELVPVLYFDEKVHSLLIMECDPRQFPEKKSQEGLRKLQEEWKKKKRPLYEPTEKITLKILRQAKKEEEEQYQKPLKRSVMESLLGTALECMVPYYRISNGAYISDEIEYYAFENVGIETNEFLKEIEKEEDLLEEMPQLLACNVIGQAVNGDIILLEPKQTVLRYDHEDPTKSIRWNSIFEFFYDNIQIN